MRKKYVIALFIIIVPLTACDVEKMYINRPRDPYGSLSREERFKLWDMYWAVETLDAAEVERLLEEGGDPNHCLGEIGWYNWTPLNVLVRTFYASYVRIRQGEEIPDPIPDVAVLRLLIDAGADINAWPYIWCRVFSYHRTQAHEPLTKTPEEAEAELAGLVRDANRLIEGLLKAGADPDKLGHPYPYSIKATYAKLGNEEAERYFAKGTRAVNEAIKKGMVWESQVDLLLQYTTLDKGSLKAARASKDPGMVEKINKLWKEQRE
jgi:hypothetical protein